MGGGIRAWSASIAVIILGALWVTPSAQSVSERPTPSVVRRAPVADAAPGCPTTATRPARTRTTQAPASTGRSGTGMRLGELPTGITAPVGGPVKGSIVSTAANIPGRTNNAGFATSMRRLDATRPDFILLNEVTRHSMSDILAHAPGFSGYRDPVVDPGTSSAWLSMENVILWRSADWHLVDAGRVKIVDNDGYFLGGRAWVGDRYATWAILQRTDGAIVPVISSHMMTNPKRFPRRPHPQPMSRIQQFDSGMRIFMRLVAELSGYGPVLVAGDMNSHPNDGSWTTSAHMTAAGYGYTKDAGVMYQFYPRGVTVASTHEFPIVSDHPALTTTLSMNGVAGAGGATPPTTPPTSSPTSSPTPSPVPSTLPSGANLTDAQLANARAIVARARAAKLPQEAWTDALAAALAESDLTDLAAKDGAVGLFGQRPGRGWGTAQQLGRPAYAADAFFGAASGSKVKGLADYPWRSMPPIDAVGALLGSPFPDKYAARLADAEFLTNYLATGDGCSAPGLGTCPPAGDVTATGSVAPAAQAVIRCVRQAFPAVRTYVGAGLGRYCDGDRLVSGLDIPVATTRLGRRVSHYLQVHAADLGINFLVFGGQTWSSEEVDAGWRPYAASDGSTTRSALVLDRVYVAVKGGSC